MGSKTYNCDLTILQRKTAEQTRKRSLISLIASICRSHVFMSQLFTVLINHVFLSITVLTLNIKYDMIGM